MAAVEKKEPAKGKRPPKKGLHGRMPVKRSINLILIDENKISPLKAVPAIILIIALAVAFSKFMVADRLIEMSKAQGEANRVANTLRTTNEALNGFEGIEDTYAHMTYAGMTSEELGRVDRVSILQLVSTILPQGEYTRSWSVSGNILSVDITGRTLEYLNELSRRIEESPIVDTCAISTAVKNEQTAVTAPNGVAHGLVDALETRRQQVENGLADFVLNSMIHSLQPVASERVHARLTIYLVKPPEEEAEPEAAEGDVQDEENKTPQKPSRLKAAPQADPATADSGEVSAP